MQLKDYIVEYPNVLSPEVCASIISKFDADDRKFSGVMGSDKRLNTDVKDSTDLFISGISGWEEEDTTIFGIVNKYMNQYRDYIIENKGIYTNTYKAIGLNIGEVSDTGYQIQKTDIGGKYIIHNDSSIRPYKNIYQYEGKDYFLYDERQYTFILYLNDRSGLENGRTVFYLGDETVEVEAEPGKILFFPADKYFPHAGEPLTEGVKYLITGWTSCLGYYPLENAK